MRRKKKKRIFPLVFMLLVCVGFCIWGAREAATIYFQKVPENVNIIKNAVSQTIEESIPFSEIVIEESEVSSGFYYQCKRFQGKTSCGAPKGAGKIAGRA